MGKYVELTKENFATTIAEGITLAKFGAPWCGPCRQMIPVMDELAEHYEGTGITIGDIDTDKQEELAVKYGIRSIPTTFIFKDGEIVDQISGAVSKQQLVTKLDSFKG